MNTESSVPWITTAVDTRCALSIKNVYDNLLKLVFLKALKHAHAPQAPKNTRLSVQVPN